MHRDFEKRADEEIIILKNKYLQAVKNKILKRTTEKIKIETATEKREYE